MVASTLLVHYFRREKLQSLGEADKISLISGSSESNATLYDPVRNETNYTINHNLSIYLWIMRTLFIIVLYILHASCEDTAGVCHHSTVWYCTH